MRLFCLFMILSFSMFSQELEWGRLSDSFLADAGDTDYILVDFMFEQCGPCKVMDKKVFNTPVFKKFISENNVSIVKLDVTQMNDHEQFLSDNWYKVRATPSVIIISKELFHSETKLQQAIEEMNVVSGMYIQAEPVIGLLKKQIQVLEQVLN